jgi:hypothetical protein
VLGFCAFKLLIVVYLSSDFEMASGMLMAFLLVAFKIFFLAMRLFYTIRWQVLGVRWQVAGVRWQVLGGRC